MPSAQPRGASDGLEFEMTIWFNLAALVTVLVGGLHSVLGERYIIGPLQRRQNLPSIFGSDLLTKRTLRFAWHLTTVAWTGLASLMLFLGFGQPLSAPVVTLVLIVTFAASAMVSAVGSRGRHFSWILFLAIVMLLWLELR